LEVRYAWLIPDRVIFVRLQGEFSLDQLWEVKARCVDMISLGKPPVHIVFNSEGLTNLPNNPEVFEEINQITHNNTGFVVVYGAPPDEIWIGVTSASNGMADKLKYPSSWQEAKTVLSELDKTLNWDDADLDVLKDP
jgi:hypothetical protein